MLCQIAVMAIPVAVTSTSRPSGDRSRSRPCRSSPRRTQRHRWEGAAVWHWMTMERQGKCGEHVEESGKIWKLWGKLGENMWKIWGKSAEQMGNRWGNPWAKLFNDHFRNRLIGGTYHFCKAYVLGLNFQGISPENMAKHMVQYLGSWHFQWIIGGMKVFMEDSLAKWGGFWVSVPCGVPIWSPVIFLWPPCSYSGSCS